jgi:hypothetical protein
MAKSKAGSQTGNLTPDHGKSGIDPIPLHAGGIRKVVGKLSTRATTLVQTSSRSEVYTKSYTPAKLQDSHTWHSDANPAEWCRVYYMGEGGGFPRVRAVVSLMSPELPIACPSTKGAPKSELINLLVGLMQD